MKIFTESPKHIFNRRWVEIGLSVMPFTLIFIYLGISCRTKKAVVDNKTRCSVKNPSKFVDQK